MSALPEPIAVLVTGAWGQMGRVVVSAVLAEPDLALVGAVDPAGQGHAAAELDSRAPQGMQVSGHLVAALEASQPQVMVDFTAPGVVMSNLQAALTRGVACVVGTTGLSETDLKVLDRLARRHDTACFVAPNFSLGAHLMMRFAAEAAPSYDYVEIIERHHERKQDAPSGTALRTAQLIAQARSHPVAEVPTPHDRAPGSRGGEVEHIHVHALRMPGYVASQEVVFGGRGEILRIEHCTTGRECFVPGVLLAVRQVRQLQGLVVGLEQLL